MIDLFGVTVFHAHPALAVAIGVVGRATVLMVLAFAVHAALGRRRALARSALWNACLVGLFLVPLSTLVLPRLRLTVPTEAEVAIPVAEPPVIVADDAISLMPGPIGPVSMGATANGVVAKLEPIGPTPAFATEPERSITVGGIVIGVYLTGVALLAARLAVSLATVARLRSRCQQVESATWNESLGRWRDRLGIARRVLLLRSEEVSVPIAVGLHRPAVIVPGPLITGARTGLIDAVLLHELGHIRRGDFGWNLMRKLVQIAYWPHPLVWLAGRLIGEVREQACDDLCVHVLGGADGYRATLLEVASGLVRRPEPSLGLAMARTTNLGRRLAWIDRTRGASRCLMHRPGRLAIAAMVASVAGVLGTVELARMELMASEQPVTQAAETRQDNQPKAIEIIVTGKDTGKPLEGARVRTNMDFVEKLWTTDREGRLRVDLSRLTFQDSFSFDLWADGYVQQRYAFGSHDPQNPIIPARKVIALLPGEETLGGTVRNEEGQPIAGARVVLRGYLGERKEPHELAYMVDCTTNPKGEWRCRSFRKATFAYLYLSHQDYVSDDHFEPRVHGQPREARQSPPDDPSLKGLRDFSDVQVMVRGVAISGKVVDEHARPVAGAEVGRLESDHLDSFSWDIPRTTTDVQGRFSFPHVRPGKYALQVKAKGHAPELKSITAGTDTGPSIIKLPPPNVLSGRFVDTRGNPIEGAYVYMSGWRRSWALGVNLKTDADGRFRWEDAPADAVQITAGRTGYDGIDRREFVPGEGEVLLTFRRMLYVSGKLLDAETGSPIKQAGVEVGIPDRESGKLTWRHQDGVTAWDGTFRANLDAEAGLEYRLRFSARGYAPFETRGFRSDEKQVDYDVRLRKSAGPKEVTVSGVVRKPDGSPLAGAEVAIAYPLTGPRERLPTVRIHNGTLQADPPLATTKTDASGRFSLSREPYSEVQSYAVVVVHPEFHAEIDRSAFEANPMIVVKPWGRIEGVARVGASPAAGAVIRYRADRHSDQDDPYIRDDGETRADAHGRFALERVIPGDVRVSAWPDGESAEGAWSSGLLLLDVKPGETARAELGGNGRPVVARIALPPGFDPDGDLVANSRFDLRSDGPNIPYPKDLLARRDRSMVEWVDRWWASPEGREHRRKNFWLVQAKLRKDGTIRVEDVPPGEYLLTLIYSTDPLRGRFATPDRIARTTKQFTIPEVPGGRSDEPFDLGVLHPRPIRTLKVGELAPPFEVETLDGRRLKLADFRGKHLLIDFWATWCGPCLAEIPELKSVHDRFGKDGRFAMLGLSVDADKEAPRKLVAEKGLGWTQGFLGEGAEGGMQDDYCVEAIPAVFLIGPDSRIKAKDLRGDSIASAVAAALREP